MRSVFASGTPSFGSCAGLQLAVAAAGGTVRKMPARMAAGIARRITATEAGRDHPLLAGRPPAWDAPAVHGDEVESLPADATLLASNASPGCRPPRFGTAAGFSGACNTTPSWRLAKSRWRCGAKLRTWSRLGWQMTRPRWPCAPTSSTRFTASPGGGRTCGRLVSTASLRTRGGDGPSCRTSWRICLKTLRDEPAARIWSRPLKQDRRVSRADPREIDKATLGIKRLTIPSNDAAG